MMSTHSASPGRTAFESICANCETVAVTLDCAEGALDDAPVFCQNCGRLRGLIGAIRKLARQSAEPLGSLG
jgi:hypothetical protein